ncbi:MAG: M20 family metallo-hydrolase [Bacteroidota bacterium]
MKTETVKVQTQAAEYIELLQQLIATTSFSRQEDKTADKLVDFLAAKGIATERYLNNIWAKNKHWQADKPVLLLNSHHDTVRPVEGWKRDPFSPDVEEGTLYGLGSNDAGASLVSLLATFVHFYEQEDLSHNIIFAASAEEEISGKDGMYGLLPYLGKIDVGIVGEPTEMQMAVAEKGLLVIEAVAKGVAGHAARTNNVNAIYEAMQDIEWLKSHRFPKTSEWLEAVKITVTQIEAGKQHNIVPDACKYVVDVRTNDCYSNREIFDILQANTKAELKARSFRLNSSQIPVSHPLVQAGQAMGMACLGSPTLSDQSVMPFPTLKLGVGDSNRSHTADEYIHLHEIENGIARYIELLGKFL